MDVSLEQTWLGRSLENLLQWLSGLARSHGVAENTRCLNGYLDLICQTTDFLWRHMCRCVDGIKEKSPDEPILQTHKNNLDYWVALG